RGSGDSTVQFTRRVRESWNSHIRHSRARSPDSSFLRKRESIYCRPVSCCHGTRRSTTWIPAFAGMTASGLPHGASFDLQNAPQLLRPPLDRPLVQRPVLPLGQLYLLGILEIVHEDGIHLRAEAGVEHVQVGFI